MRDGARKRRESLPAQPALPAPPARLLAAIAVVALAAAACGKSATTAPSSNSTCSNLPNATTILIANNAVCPQSLTVAPGTRVTFINNDTRTHEMDSDPHPEHTDCPELNQVGRLEPGQQRDSGNLNTPRRCGFHDHLNDGNAALRGSITIR
jgi:plastocyanin